MESCYDMSTVPVTIADLSLSVLCVCLFPSTQIAVHFADLHDTPGRMQAKGVIRRQVQWAESRAFFYWRLRRRLIEFQVANVTGDMAVPGARKELIQRIKAWFLARQQQLDGDGSDAEEVWEDDRAMVTWFEVHDAEVQAFVAGLQCDAHASDISAQLSALVRDSCRAGEDAGSALRAALQSLSESERVLILDALN